MMQRTPIQRYLMMNQTRLRMGCAFVCVLWLALGGVVPAQAATPKVGALTQTQAQTELVQPTRLLIPSLEIDAAIEAVGQDETDVMEEPSTIDKVAWYNLGPRPGENGNSVIAGHYDDVKGKPAVFWDLDELVAGDEIVVRFSDESEQRFEVMTVETYDTDEAPLERIFGVDFERDLNLITCDGQWNAKSKLYERRLVVYARLIREGTASVVPQESSVTSDQVVVEQVGNVAEKESVASMVATEASVADASLAGTNVEYVDDPTQANTPSSLPIPPTPGTSYTRQNRGQPPTTR